MNTPAIDSRMAMDAVAQQDLVQKKQNIDALRARLGDAKTKEEKLRESCEGFEAIFLQKMWEQMRKNVSKEGYLHSKDEEAYQSMFDVELSKKMASAGGIGLADMLYEQLSQKLANTGRTTTPGSHRSPIVQQPAPNESVLAEKKDPVTVTQSSNAALTVANLYSALEEPAEDQKDVAEEPQDPLMQALAELRKEFDEKEKNEKQEEESAIVAVNEDAAKIAEQAASQMQRANKMTEKLDGNEIAASSWQSQAGRVSAKPKPLNKFKSRIKANPQAEPTPVANPPSRSLLSEKAAWPLDGAVTSHFGWQEGAGNGKREWNSGVTIAAPAGSAVRPAMPGKVVFAGDSEGFNGLVIVDHGNDYKSYYGNVDTSSLKVGDTVEPGMNFAKTKSPQGQVENKENSSSLYFALKRGEIALNPEAAITRTITTASR